MKRQILEAMAAVFVCASAHAQVNSGSNGSDGAFNPTTNVVINMADHPNGIYQYTSVNVPTNVTVTFIPNANNTPIVWLIQSNCVVNGLVDLSGEYGVAQQGGLGEVGGWRGGNGGTSVTSGQGPGGGAAGDNVNALGANASFGTLGSTNDQNIRPGPTYGTPYLIPLLGGSGGGGAAVAAYGGVGAGGGGGAVLIAASGDILVSGAVVGNGGGSGYGSINNPHPAGGGSGGSVRLVASRILGGGEIRVHGGIGSGGPSAGYGNAGEGRVRFDTFENDFSGLIMGVFTQGFQPVIIPSPGQLPQVTVTSVGGVPISASPTGVLSTPDAVLSAQQNNPIPIIVHCSNVPLNTQITVSVKPANGARVSATALNNTGTLSSSTATISINMPRGGGIIYATAAN